MGIMLRMMTAMVSLYMLFVVGLFVIGLLFGAEFYHIVILALLFILLQWWIGPVIIRWIYKIDWVTLGFFDPEIQEYVQRVVEDNKIRMPRLGIVRDGNPNAFCFGRTRNDAYLVITQGILDYCDTSETKAVIGHELGHIVHNDFVVMTMLSAVPILFYIIFRGCMEVCKQPSRGGKNDPRAYVALIGIIAFIIYFISNLIVLLISRYREYWADRFSAETTRDTAPLINALVTIAYGLAMQSKTSQEKKKKDKIYENSLMIFDSKVARNLAFSASSVRESETEVSIQDMKEAMAWDLWNPWGAYFEIFMSHPLPAKRIIHLDKVGTEMGIEPYLNFDLKKPESYFDEFLQDIFAKYSFLIALAFALWYSLHDPAGATTMFLSGAGIAFVMYLHFYKYPMSFRTTCNEALIDDPKASPIRGFPVRLSGRIIGRGNPGLIFNEDLKLDDGRALMLLDYHQVSKLIDFFVGLFKTEEKMNKEITLTGWYRRKVTPFVEIYEMEIEGKKKHLYTRDVYLVLGILTSILGFLFLADSSYPFIPVGFVAVFALSLMVYYQFIRGKYLREYPVDCQGNES